MARKKNKIELEEFLRSVLIPITENFQIDEAILYGSYAKGNATGLSDIYLAIISPDLTEKSIYANNRLIKTKLKLFVPGLQLSSFASNTFYHEDFVDSNFIKEIKRTGKVLYSKVRGIDLSCI